MGKYKEKTSLSNVQDMIRSFIPDKQPLTHRQLLECRKILNVIKLNEELTAENDRLLTELSNSSDHSNIPLSWYFSNIPTLIKVFSPFILLEYKASLASLK